MMHGRLCVLSSFSTYDIFSLVMADRGVTLPASVCNLYLHAMCFLLLLLLNKLISIKFVSVLLTNTVNINR